jgi:hypothetical protein
MALRNTLKKYITELGFYELKLLKLNFRVLLLTWKTDFNFIFSIYGTSPRDSTVLLCPVYELICEA